MKRLREEKLVHNILFFVFMSFFPVGNRTASSMSSVARCDEAKRERERARRRKRAEKNRVNHFFLSLFLFFLLAEIIFSLSCSIAFL